MSTPAVGRSLLLVASVIVIATLAAALWVMDSPSKQRDRKLDQRRVSDLSTIESNVAAWHAEHGKLPKTLDELAQKPGVSLRTKDPVSGTAYVYSTVSERVYRLCAEFATSTAERDRSEGRRWYDGQWPHPAGRHCFERKIAATAGEAANAAAGSAAKAVTP